MIVCCRPLNHQSLKDTTTKIKLKLSYNTYKHGADSKLNNQRLKDATAKSQLRQVQKHINMVKIPNILTRIMFAGTMLVCW
jgi:hypothetical protein